MTAAADLFDALDNNAARRAEPDAWRHVRTIALAGQGDIDARIVEACDQRITQLERARCVTLPPDVRGYLTSQPDELLVSWLRLSPQAVDVLTERERSHALALLDAAMHPICSDEYRTGQCAAYVRERLVRGDHVAAAARAAWDVGALITIDRKLYRVERHIGRGYRLRGPAGGILELTPPLREGAVWYGWIGGVAASNSRLATFRRQPDGSFARVVGEMGRPARKAARP